MSDFQYNFTSDWFSNNIPIWSQILGPLKGTPLQILEIGSYEGRSCTWLCEVILTHPSSKIYCIDTFGGSEGYTKEQKTGIYERFLHNTSGFGDKVVPFKGFSEILLKDSRITSEKFDIAYIDGDHSSVATLRDAILVFPLIKTGGIIIFDDFTGGDISSGKYPFIGINSFLTCYSDKIEVVYSGYQLIIRKIV